MQETAASSILPKLLKSRIVHTRIALACLAPLVMFTQPVAAQLPWLYWLMRTLGLALVIACVLGRGYSTLFIGGRKNDAVVAAGPYAVVRNPLYVFSFLGVIGVGLQSGSFAILALLATAFVLYYPEVVTREEGFLMHKFGEAYKEYMQNVPRWVPNFSLWREPDYVEAQPKFVRKTLMDASVFFLPLVLFELLSLLRAGGVLPYFMMF